MAFDKAGDMESKEIVLDTGEGLAKEVVDAWLATGPSDGPRRQTFHRKTDELDARYRRGA